MQLSSLTGISAMRRAVESTSHESSGRPKQLTVLFNDINNIRVRNGSLGILPSFTLSSCSCGTPQLSVPRSRPLEMPKEGVRRVRKGTRSCQECRHRKVKCVWAGDDAAICNNCVARSRTCLAQGPASPIPEAAQPSSRARIRQLEDQVGSLWSVVHKLETRAQHGTTRVSQDTSTDRPYYTSRKTTPSSHALEEQAASGETHENDTGTPSDTDDSEPDGFNLPTNQPSHLRQLFDNGLLDAQNSREPSWQTCDYSGYQSASKTYLTVARRQSQNILPSRDDVAAIAGFSFPWMSIYNALFPRIQFMATAEEMLTQYDELRKPNANPMSLANLLISLALSIRQIPEADLKPLVPGIPNVSRFIDDVIEIVDRTIASNDTLAATLEGIETSLLFIRL
jgi:hypothetical protein